jgi:hypothetical protein
MLYDKTKGATKTPFAIKIYKIIGAIIQFGCRAQIFCHFISASANTAHHQIIVEMNAKHSLTFISR